ncbi:MAG TPA: oxygen-independent coproporphyrinogen III oxidase [Planctomycetota bacterium]|nr:oxygen-independent coproporphyrinogen III oxidase [Planctomycetota bacterium]
MKPEILSVDEELLLRMAVPGPRYTSYPTVPEWREPFPQEGARAALRRASRTPDDPLSLYVHLPFCERRCLFCGCTVEITRRADRVESYLGALEMEIAMVAGLLGDRRAVLQLHLGGGTPTHLSPAELRRLHAALAQRFEILPGAEVSLEVHPHVTSFEHVDTLAELGFNRVSMGVQDTDPHVQEVIHRDQTVEETERLVEHCRRRGFEGVNLDLMYGLPEQTEATFAATLDTVARIRPDRLAVYGYAHVPWLKKTQTALERWNLPDPVLRARLFALAIERLGAAGYDVIGLDHFALPTDALHRALTDGTLQRNFMGYTTHAADDMVAFGMSSIADAGGTFLQNERETKPYEERVRKGELPVVRGLDRSPEDDLRREAIQSIMCRMRLDLGELEQRFDRTDLAEHFAREWRELEPFVAEGFCTLTPRRLDVLPKGRLFLRHMAMVFDEYLRAKEPQGPRFSQTV